MNFYNPYYMSYIPQSKGLFARIFGSGINFSSILSGTQKTLNIINQAIPIVKEVKPIINNAKTMFNIMSEFKRVDEPVKTNNVVEDNDGLPTFFQ